MHTTLVAPPSLNADANNILKRDGRASTGCRLAKQSPLLIATPVAPVAQVPIDRRYPYWAEGPRFESRLVRFFFQPFSAQSGKHSV